MANTPRLAIPLMSNATEQNWATYSAGMRAIDALVNTVVQAIQTTPPGSPTEGHGYIVLATGTGAWAGHDNDIAYYVNAAWEFHDPTAGWTVWNVATGQFLYWSGSSWAVQALSAIPYDIPMSFSAVPTSNQIIGRTVIPRDVVLAANFTGSAGYITTNPTATFVIDVKDDGTTIGTISISTSGVFTFATTSGTSKTVLSGSRLEFVAPGTADGTAAGIAATLKGTS